MANYLPTNPPETFTHTEKSYWCDPVASELPVKVKVEHSTPMMVQFGPAGHTVHYPSSRLTGYESKATFFATSKWWAHDFADRLDPEAYEGLPYIDTTGMEDEDRAHMAIKGPMVDVNLGEGQVDRAPAVSEAMKAGLEGLFSTLAKVADQQRKQDMLGSLDHTDTATYMKLWKHFGAEVGFIRKGKFVPDETPAPKQLTLDFS